MHEATRRRALQKCVQRWQSGKGAGAFDKWREACSRKLQLKITCGKIIVRWKNMDMSVSFSKWAADTGGIHTQIILLFFLLTICQRRPLLHMERCLTDSFCIIAEHQKVVQQKMRKTILMWRNRSTGAAFERWVEHTDEQKQMRNLILRIVARWTKKTASSVFWAWAGIL